MSAPASGTAATRETAAGPAAILTPSIRPLLGC